MGRLFYAEMYPPSRPTPLIPRLPILAALCFLTLLVYWPGLSGTFIFDDNANIVSNDRLHVDTLSLHAVEGVIGSGISGPLKRPISMLSFALNYYFTGLDPFYFKLTNLLIHIAAGIAVFFMTWQLLLAYRERHAPQLNNGLITAVTAAVTAAWLLHPLNLTGVLYVVQRMTSLSGLFTFVGVASYVAGRRRLNHNSGGLAPILVSLLVFTSLATLSKENGALLPLFLLITEFVLFGFKTPRKTQKWALYAIFAVSVALPAAATVIFTAIHPQWILHDYAIRNFTLGERLMTEARVVCFYIHLIIAPTADQLGLFHDDLQTSSGLLSPPTTLLALIALGTLFITAIIVHRRAPLFSLGVLWFFAGQCLESTALPLELIYEHRNYVAMYGILLPMLYYALYPLRLPDILLLRRALVGLFILLLTAATAVRASDWGNPVLMAMVEVHHHPQSPRSNNFAGEIFATLFDATKDQGQRKKYFTSAFSYFKKGGQIGGNNLTGLFGALAIQNAFDGSANAEIATTLIDRLRNMPFANNTSNQLLALDKCEEDHKCKLPLKLVRSIYDAALGNPTLRGANRTVVLMAAAEHLINIAGNLGEGLELLHQAVKLEPEGTMARFNYIKVLIAAQQYQKARRQLTIAERLDKWGFYSPMYGREERELAKADANAMALDRTPAAAHPFVKGTPITIQSRNAP